MFDAGGRGKSFLGSSQSTTIVANSTLTKINYLYIIKCKYIANLHWWSHIVENYNSKIQK